MTSRGDKITLAALAALAMGAAARKRGGRNTEEDKAREAWSYMLEKEVKDLSESQKKALLRDRVELEDGNKPIETKLLIVEEAVRLSFHPKSVKMKTLRGGKQPIQIRLIFGENEEPLTIRALPFVIAMQDHVHEWHYYLFPKGATLAWYTNEDEP